MSVLVDTSVWLDHLRSGSREMERLLDQDAVNTHPYVVGELACGNLHDRRTFLDFLGTLRPCPLLASQEVLHFLEIQKLSGLGLNWVDVNVLVSALVYGSSLWTRDKALHKAAEKLRIAFYS